MDIQRALRSATATGKVLLGAHQTIRSIEAGKARLVIVAQNFPEREAVLKSAKGKNVPAHEYGGFGMELGPACGKPFAVAALAVLDAGESDILQLAR